ncbi:MAG: hypothetical protein WA746_10045 [Isosphaeraceae bacterium]
MPSTQFAKKMLSAYVDLEPWEEDHDRALACFAIEEAMSFGNLIFRWVSERDAIWHTRVLESKIEYNEAEREEWIEIYRNWLGASERLLLTIARLEGQGFEVRGADEFRRNCDEARGISADDDVISVDEALINLRDEAIDEHRRERTHSCGGSGDA